MSIQHKLSDRFRGSLSIDFNDPESYERAFDTELLPLAKALRLCATSDSIADIGSSSAAASTRPARDVREQAVRQMRIAACTVLALKYAHMGKPERDWLQLKQLAMALSCVCQGYLLALRDVSLGTSRRGATGRKRIGAASRERVRHEAERLMRPGLSKEQAAPEIAEAVKLSPARVRRLLTELFPGAQWNGE